MSSAPDSIPNVRFENFELDFRAGELRRNGVRISLQEQPLRLLSVLVEHPGEVVTREELRREIWPADTFVDFDASLGIAVLKIRQALGDSATHPRFVETIPRRGYRFIAPVRPVEETNGRIRNVPEARPRVLVLALLAGLAGVTLYFFTIAPTAKPLNETWTIKPLTSFEGMDDGADFSPDGRFLAFSRRIPGDSNIFVMPMGGGNAVPLTDSPADDFLPRWSPDGRQIAYLSDDGVTKKVYLMPPLGGAPRVLAETNIPYLERFVESWKSLGSAPWSPDARELLFSRLEPGRRIGVWKINLDTNQQTQLTFPPAGSDDLAASWSFDGRSIAFTRVRSGKGSLWLLPAGGGEPRALLADEHDNQHPAWSTDSRRIVFHTNRAGPVNLWDVAAASGRLRQLTTGPGENAFPSVCRNGGLVYVNFSAGWSLYSLTVETGQQQRLTSDHGRHMRAHFSPDGKYIAYDSDRTGNFEIWILDVASKSQRPLTSHAAADMAPDWSPSGREIVFISNREGVFQLWVADAASGVCRRVVETAVLAPPALGVGSSATAPRWSPDEKKIGFLVKDPQRTALWSVDPDGKNAREMIRGALDFDWYRDSQHVVYTRLSPDGSGGRELVLANLTAGAHEVLHRGPHIEVAAARDGSSVTFVHARSHFRQNLYAILLGPVPPRGHLPRSPKQLTDGKGRWHAHNGSYSPDGKMIVYTRDTPEADVLMIENYR